MRRNEWHDLYNDRAWRKASKAFLAANPICAFCEGRGKVTASQVTDHIRPHKGNLDLFWDESNWQPLCLPCHDSDKTRIENSGFSDRVGADGWPLDSAHPANR